MTALPKLPAWLPSRRAAAAVVEGGPLLLEEIYPALEDIANRWYSTGRVTRGLMHYDDILSALALSCRHELARWGMDRISPSRRAAEPPGKRARANVAAYRGLVVSVGETQKRVDRTRLDETVRGRSLNQGPRQAGF